jgi:hypothetical protein
LCKTRDAKAGAENRNQIASWSRSWSRRGAEITKCEFQRLEEKIMVAKKVFVNGIIYFLLMKNMQDPELIQHGRICNPDHLTSNSLNGHN